mgnify:CR=1 FL=1
MEKVIPIKSITVTYENGTTVSIQDKSEKLGKIFVALIDQFGYEWDISPHKKGIINKVKQWLVNFFKV